jgi:hypothetical protein
MKSRIDKTEYRFEITKDLDMIWYKNNSYHREKDLPAIIYNNSIRVWYINGLRHRKNGKPAIVEDNGSMSWWNYGEFVRKFRV